MINVGGFLFEDEATAAQARKEEEGIRFIRERSALNNPEGVLKLYKTLLQQKLFSTAVGLSFLMELQKTLYAASSIKKEDIPAIDMTDFRMVPVEDEETKKKNAKKARKEKSYKSSFYVALFFAIVFGISVLGMFVIAEVSSDNVTILN